MRDDDRKLAWAAVIVLAVLVLELAWIIFIGPSTGAPYYTAHCEQNCEVPWWGSAVAWTCIFTGALTLSSFTLWWDTRKAARANAEDTKIVERAYLFADLRESFRSNGDDLEFLLRFHNSGKTPALAYEVYGEGGAALPPRRDYSNPTARIENVDISVQADAIGQLGSVYYAKGAKAIWGYAKYRDVFGDDHITGFAAVWNEENRVWRGNDPGPEWCYWS